jgi:predicted pyridoxine 5'-phosphate oxidase superfamily flavin-nucleotide-binding protein
MSSQTLTKPMRKIITDYHAGAVATVNDDGTPAVSPKATFVIVDDNCIAFGDIRSPGTVANIKRRPDVEVNFIDVLTRQAVRVAGRASIVEKNSEQGHKLMPLFQQSWAPYLDVMQAFVSVSITRAELVMSPAYDVGYDKSELAKINLEKLNQLANSD